MALQSQADVLPPCCSGSEIPFPAAGGSAGTLGGNAPDPDDDDDDGETPSTEGAVAPPAAVNDEIAHDGLRNCDGGGGGICCGASDAVADPIAQPLPADTFTPAPAPPPDDAAISDVGDGFVAAAVDDAGFN